MDLIHLKVPELHQLEIQLITQVGTVVEQRGWYQIQLHNRGNTTRQLQLDIIDTEGDHLCQYFLERSFIEIHPLEQILVNLYIDPPPAWQRPFTGRAFNFTSKIRDLQGFFLPISELPGVLLWKARPLWHLYLLILAILLLLGGLIGLTWWLLTKKPPQPEVISFTPQNTLYNAIDNQAIRLNWQISQPKQLAQLQLKGVSPEGKVISQPISYDFSQGIPASLQEFCTLGQTLLCINVPTDAFQAGDYQFQLILITQEESLQALPPVTTSIISILPIPKPSLLEFTATSSTYQKGVQGGIKLNWKVENFRFVKQLQLSVRSINSQKPLKTLIPSFVFQPQEANPIPPFLQPYCQAINKQLVCYDVPTPINQVGKFVFQLTLDPLYNPPHSSVSVQTLPIEVKAKPIPIEIVRFEIDGNPAPPIYRVNLAEKSFVSLLWQVKGSKTLQVDLLPVPGTVQPSGGLVYRLSAEPKTETIILTAIDAQGQKQSRSVMIETYLPPSPSQTNQGGTGIPGQPGQKEDSTTSAPKAGETSKGSSNTNTDAQSAQTTDQTTEKEKELLEPPPPPMTTEPQFR